MSKPARAALAAAAATQAAATARLAALATASKAATEQRLAASVAHEEACDALTELGRPAQGGLDHAISANSALLTGAPAPAAEGPLVLAKAAVDRTRAAYEKARINSANLQFEIDALNKAEGHRTQQVRQAVAAVLREESAAVTALLARAEAAAQQFAGCMRAIGTLVSAGAIEVYKHEPDPTWPGARWTYARRTQMPESWTFEDADVGGAAAQWQRLLTRLAADPNAPITLDP